MQDKDIVSKYPGRACKLAGIDTGQITSELLLGPKGQLDIIHNCEIYKLRITANKKLILTK